MDPIRKTPKKFTKKFGNKVVNGQYFRRRTGLKTIKTFQTICAQCEKDPCCDWVGEEGAGHFVKMVHNGIEYGKKIRQIAA